MSLTSNLIMSFKKVQKIVTPDVPVVNTLFVISIFIFIPPID